MAFPTELQPKASRMSQQNGTHLHISLTPFRNESRVLKETEATHSAGLASDIVIVALHEEGLPEQEVIDAGREVLRVRLKTRAWPTNLTSQAVKYVEFSFRVFGLARQHRARLVSIHTLALLPLGAALKWLLGAKLVYDAHELETEAQGRSGLRQRLARIVERLLIGQADLTVVVSPGIERWYRDVYGLKRIVTVLNAPKLGRPAPSDALHRAAGIPAGRKIILYQGALTTGRGVEAILAAAPALAEVGYNLIFMGYGELQYMVEQAAREQQNVHVVPAVLPQNVLDYTASADIGLCSIEDTCLSYRLSLPNKLFEYIFAGIPVIASNLPEMAKLINENKVGVCIDEWSAERLVEAVAAVEAMQGPELDERLRGVAERHNWGVQGAALVKAYKDFVLSPAISGQSE